MRQFWRDLCTGLLICVALVTVGYCTGPRAATTILPPGATCFQQAAGPVSSGSVNMFVPGTVTPKNTFKDAGQVTLNTNPIQLDANGCAIIYGTGSYRQQVFSGPVVGGLATGLLLYDVTTADTSSFQNVFWAGLSGGTANVVTVVDAGFNSTDGSVINFIALNTNTGAATLTPSGSGIAQPILQPSGTGPVALTANCITANNPISVVWSSTATAFLLLTACPTGSSSTVATVTPGGYLTLSNDTNNIIQTADISGATSVFYSPYSSNQIPIWNGSSFVIRTFTSLTLTLNASVHLANTIYDVCVFLNAGTPTIVTGPAWANSGAGTGSRGTGGASAQIARLNGLWVNSVQISAANGSSTFTVPAQQCTYIGSLLIDGTAGQVSNFLSFGGNGGHVVKWGVWNAYNRLSIRLLAGDTTASWTYGSAVVRPSNNSTSNALTAFTGLAEDEVEVSFAQSVNATVNNTGSTPNVGIGVNSTTAFAGRHGTFTVSQSTAGTGGADMVASVVQFPALGINVFTSLEAVSAGVSTTFNGGSANMQLLARYRG